MPLLSTGALRASRAVLCIIETASGPILVDDEDPQSGFGDGPTRLELLAEELGVDPDELRDHIRLSIAVKLMDGKG